MNDYSTTNLGDGTESTDAANYGQSNNKMKKIYYLTTVSNQNLNSIWQPNE